MLIKNFTQSLKKSGKRTTRPSLDFKDLARGWGRERGRSGTRRRKRDARYRRSFDVRTHHVFRMNLRKHRVKRSASVTFKLRYAVASKERRCVKGGMRDQQRIYKVYCLGILRSREPSVTSGKLKRKRKQGNESALRLPFFRLLVLSAKGTLKPLLSCECFYINLRSWRLATGF